MTEINRRTSLVTISLGSGADADVMFLFTSDICGESARLPRHARAWGNLGALHQTIREERVKALAGFRTDVASGAFPGKQQVAAISDAELEAFRQKLPR
jgi:3-methyl-2-oxobutanoate hydroxymethyltransferase